MDQSDRATSLSPALSPRQCLASLSSASRPGGGARPGAWGGGPPPGARPPGGGGGGGGTRPNTEGASYAQLTPAEKDAISHRGRALEALEAGLDAFLKQNNVK